MMLGGNVILGGSEPYLRLMCECAVWSYVVPLDDFPRQCSSCKMTLMQDRETFDAMIAMWLMSSTTRDFEQALATFLDTMWR